MRFWSLDRKVTMTFGYDPKKYHTGRAPLEAAAQDIVLNERQVAFRCNTLTVENGVMVDHSADHITTDESAQLIKTVSERLGGNGISFHAGVSYRHIAVVDCGLPAPARDPMGGPGWTVDAGELALAQCTPPHDILGKPVDSYLPTGSGSERLRQVNPRAALVETRFGVLDPVLLASPRGVRPKGQPDSAGHATQMQTFVWKGEGDLCRARFAAAVATWPNQLYRAKGFVRLDGELCLFNFVAGRWQTEPAGPGGPGLVFIGPAISGVRGELIAGLERCGHAL